MLFQDLFISIYIGHVILDQRILRNLKEFPGILRNIKEFLKEL